MEVERSGRGRSGWWTPSWGGARLRKGNEGRWGYILAWVLGVPIPILIIVYLLRGCT